MLRLLAIVYLYPPVPSCRAVEHLEFLEKLVLLRQRLLELLQGLHLSGCDDEFVLFLVFGSFTFLLLLTIHKMQPFPFVLLKLLLP